MTLELPETFYEHARSSVRPVGSRVTCNPAPTDTDADYLVYVKSTRVVNNILTADGWEYGGSQDERWEQGSFEAYRKGENNLIVAYDKKFHSLFIAATSVAKRLNLMVKADRIALFRAVLNGEACE